jgi:DNA-binding transcriptional ArsR family regulator
MDDPAELFEAISHPERIKILKILKDEPCSFASLKRKLGISSSGNLDYHLKKLGQLVAAREDGKYIVTDVGKEALLSIEAIESWTETKKRKITIPANIPKEVLFLGTLEVCATLLTSWFLAQAYVLSSWGFLPPLAIFLTGLFAAFGLFTQQYWSWKVILVKSALIFSMSLFLLNYSWQPDKIAVSDPLAICYLAFVSVEIVIAILVLRHPLQDFLGIVIDHKVSFLAFPASFLCILSGILVITLEMTQKVPKIDNLAIIQCNFANFMGDVTVLAALTVIIGGVLILLKSYVLGALMSILCGLYPRPPQGSHAYDFVISAGVSGGVNGLFAGVIAVVAGSLPIIGGIIALFIVMRKIGF